MIGALLAALLLTMSPATPASPSHRPCPSEDSTGCVWDARHMGNGQGHSFKVNPHGKVTYISHRRAHRLLWGGRS